MLVRYLFSDMTRQIRLMVKVNLVFLVAFSLSRFVDGAFKCPHDDFGWKLYLNSLSKASPLCRCERKPLLWNVD